MKQGCRGGLVDPTAPKAMFPVWVVSQAANILDPIFVSGIEFHLHALLGDAFTASRMTIPRKQNERRTGPSDREQSRERKRVGRLINRLKQFRRIATRYEKRAVNYKAMLTLAAILLWL